MIPSHTGWDRRGAGRPLGEHDDGVTGFETAPHLVPASAVLTSLSLTVDGMPCAQCEVAIRAAVKKLHGVQQVSFNERRVMVLYDPARVTPQRVIDAAGAVGFGASIAN